MSSEIHETKGRTPNYAGYNRIQQPDFPDNLEQYYVCGVDKSKLNGGRNTCSEEQPLDFSRKPIPTVMKDEYPRKFKKLALNSTIASNGSEENSETSSDCVDDSYEGTPERFTAYSLSNRIRTYKEAIHTNGFENNVLDERREKYHWKKPRMYSQATRNNPYRRNGLKGVNSSGSEDEFHSKYLAHKGGFEPNGDHSQNESSHAAHVSEDGKKSPHLPHSLREMPHVPNGHSDSTERNDRFHIQDILSRNNQSAPKEPSETTQQINNSVARQQTSTRSTSNDLGKEDNRPLTSTSPSHSVNSRPESTSSSHFVSLPLGSTNPSDSVNSRPESTSSSYSVNLPRESTAPSDSANLPRESTKPSHSLNLPASTSSSHPVQIPPSIFPFVATDRLHESSGIVSPYGPSVFPSYHVANSINYHSPEVSDYSRLCSYPPGTMHQTPFNPTYAHYQHQQAMLVGQDPQSQKKQRPFKNIDPSELMRHIPSIQSAAALNLLPSPFSAYNSSATKYPECTGSTLMDSSPQRLSPDSPCIVNGSSGNESLAQDINDESGRKKIRRIPPEEKDEKYLEKRRKNNLAAKKSRDERRRKEDILAISVRELLQKNLKLETERRFIEATSVNNQNRLDSIIGNLISFREKLEGQAKELFEEAFRLFLPQQ